ncbi:MAG: energy-coupling factor transport system ATP-binding protein [Solirubrobacterales bacterium]|nr:energy-coupling factor transport system ATP-binding protein [Solirubrobacterales bacterium]
MPEPALVFENFSYRYPGAASDALDAISLTIDPGELVVLAGRSASGKSTLLRAACGLVPHFHGGEAAGRAAVTGLDIRDHGPAELTGRAAFVAQDPETQVVSTTVRAELELPLELRGDSPSTRARAVEEVALALAIPHLLDRATDTLSGGELQRVALAAALVTRPPLILLDEPTSQLDPVAGDELIWLLRRLNEEWGLTILLCEHRLERCLAAADRTIAMADGAIAYDGTPEAFLDWALATDPILATPAAQLFHQADISPLPTGVKAARRFLAASGVGPRVAGAKPGVARSAPGVAALRIKDLWVALDSGEQPTEVLRGMDLAATAGERIALMGRNGAGKSTLLRTLAGLIPPARGRYETPTGCALLSQTPGDYFVQERVADEFAPGVAGPALAAVGLEGVADADPRDLSGGERQRLALAIVMAGRSGARAPGLVCFDEPTRGMDRACKADLAALIDELAAAGAAVIVATHDVEFAAEFADRVILLGEGEPIADGSCAEILSGGWYFATEVARILDVDGVITAEDGAALLRAAASPAPAESGSGTG